MVTEPILAKSTLNSNPEMYLSWRNFLFDIHAVADLQGSLGINCLQLFEYVAS